MPQFQKKPEPEPEPEQDAARVIMRISYALFVVVASMCGSAIVTKITLNYIFG